MDADFSAPGNPRNNGFAPIGRGSDPLYPDRPATNGHGWAAFGTSTTNSGPLTSPRSRRTTASNGYASETGPHPVPESTALGDPTPSPSTRALFHSLGNRNPASGEFPLSRPEHPRQIPEQPTSATPSTTTPLPSDAAAWLAELAAGNPSTTSSPAPDPLLQPSPHPETPNHQPLYAIPPTHPRRTFPTPNPAPPPPIAPNRPPTTLPALSIST